MIRVPPLPGFTLARRGCSLFQNTSDAETEALHGNSGALLDRLNDPRARMRSCWLQALDRVTISSASRTISAGREFKATSSPTIAVRPAAKQHHRVLAQPGLRLPSAYCKMQGLHAARTRAFSIV